MIKLPQKFEEILNKDSSNYYKGAVYTTCHRFDEIFSENRLYFFEEYTDHGIRHINSVLEACERLITPDTYKLLSEKDISILILSVFLHDLGMHLQPLTFKKMIAGGYDDVLRAEFGDQKWSILWENYLFEAKKFNDQQRKNIFGDVSVYVTEPDLNNPDTLTGIHRKLIGEFIRRHHPRIAFEVAFNGLTTHDGSQIDFCPDFDYKHKLLAGLLARSHGMNIRNTFSFLHKHFAGVWKRPFGTNVIYLMAVLRLADYFQIDSSRVLKVPFLTRLFQSPVSFDEHQKHLQTTYVQQLDDDPETLYITAEPINSTFFLALENLFSDIQKEVDNSWAVLGEVYGLKSYTEQPKLAYRRIRSNIDDGKIFGTTVPYIPERISFTVDKEIPKLLVGPLYGYDPSYGVRELLQNAIDACWEREFYEKKKGITYESAVSIKITPFNDQYEFSIVDNGKGMTLDEIKNYFLRVGGSFRKSIQWQHDHVDAEGHSNVNKNGRFGIGVLAAYLLGEEIHVKTKSIFSSTGYVFKTTLDQSQIEITKRDDLEYGTVITIVVSKKTFKALKRENYQPDLFSRRPNMFYEWFVLKSPKVAYQMPAHFNREEGLKEVYVKNLLEFNEGSIYWQEILDNDYRRIVWAYLGRFEKTIICNGFVIPNPYSLNDSRLTAPALMIFDNDAKLPLNLDRTSLEHPLPFNDKLESDIYRDMLALLLVMEVDDVFTARRIWAISFDFNHPAIEEGWESFKDVDNSNYGTTNLILGREGYLLHIPAFLRQLSELNYLMVFDDGNVPDINNELNIEVFDDFDVDLINVISLRASVKQEHNKQNVIDAFMRPSGIKIIECSNEIYSILKDEGHNLSDLNIANKKKFLNESAKNVLFVYFKYTYTSYYDDLFGDIVTDLLGDDLLIPYNIEDRKKKFPKAFKELEPYMRKYLEEK